MPDYRDIIKTPMDLELMAEKLDRGEYLTPEDFLKDIELIRDNCNEYNPPTGQASGGPCRQRTAMTYLYLYFCCFASPPDAVNKSLRKRAMELVDESYHLIENAEEDFGTLMRVR